MSSSITLQNRSCNPLLLIPSRAADGREVGRLTLPAFD